MFKTGKNRALVLFSGGLDSMLAVKILQQQNFEVTGLVFTSYFFDEKKARKFANSLKIELVKKNFSKNHLKVIREPKYGYGKGLNPCIDCHGLMITEAKDLFIEKGYDVLATGEVLGQRPFSQNKRVFLEIEKKTQLEGLILRPLSAGLLPETKYEKKGFIDRKKLYGIQNKSRKEQYRLADIFGIEEFATPAGGCVLTETMFTKKVSALLEFTEKPSTREFDLLKIGRHFWLKDEGANLAWIILGKNREENRELVKIKKEKETLILRADEQGPSALVIFGNCSGSKKAVAVKKAKLLIFKYSGKKSQNCKKINYIFYEGRKKI